MLNVAKQAPASSEENKVNSNWQLLQISYKPVAEYNINSYTQLVSAAF